MTTKHKNGDKTNSDIFRGIAVINSMSRVYGEVLKGRIKQEYVKMEADEQAGFRVGRSTVDHVFTLTRVLQKRVAGNQQMLLHFDLKKVYEFVPILSLCQL